MTWTWCFEMLAELLSNPDDLLVVTAELRFGTPGAANVLRIVPAAGSSCWYGVCQVD